jgi:uncharacterized protein
MINSLITWFRGHLPTRESIAANRWTRPFARHLLRPDLWRFNRRSVPRAVALGLFVGPIVPVAHTVIAAVAAIPSRANIVIAVAVTWFISNPVTWYPLYKFAYVIGKSILHLDQISPMPAATQEATHEFGALLARIMAKAGPKALEVATGTFVIATLVAALGYVLSSFLWRLRIGRKWRARRRRS